MACTCHSKALTKPLILFSFYTLISVVNCLTFSNPETAFAQYFPDWLPAGQQAASFRFKSVSRDALLLLHHFSNRSSGEPDYNFWIELKAGKLQATHVFETYVETVTIGEGLDNDQWHTVDYNKDTAGLLRLNLDGREKEIKLNSHRYGLAKETLTSLSHNSVVTIGGLAPSSTEMAPRQFGRLLGCMDRVKFLTQNGLLREIAVQSTDGTKAGCENQCFTANLCQQGQCINQYYRTVCDCFGTGYEGQYCQKAGNMELTFQGHNFIQYQLNKMGHMVSRDKLRLALQFKVGAEHQSGVLFYAVGAVPVETYLAVFMQDGLVVIKAYLGSDGPIVMKSTTTLNDNSWHNIFIRHDGRLLLTVIDDQRSSNQISGDNYLFHLDPDMYVGGGPELRGYAGLDVSSNFVGCLKEVYVDFDNLIGDVQSNSSKVMFHGGDPMFKCVELGHTPLSFPTKRSQLILNEWTTGDLNLKFIFRTSFANGVIVYTLISVDDTPDGILQVRLVNGSMELQLDLGVTGGTNRQKTVTVGTSLHNTAWHDVSLILRTGNILLTVDGRMVGIPHKHTLTSRSAVYVGSDVSGANTGFEGCMKQIRIQGTALIPTEIVHSDMANGVTLDGCNIALNPCANGEFVCENGGACMHESNGTRCICKSDGYIGSRCQFPIYKKSCADYFRAGDFESGPKMIDLDGPGPLPAAYVVCDFSMGSPKTTVEHNFMPKTLVRSVKTPSLDFELEYRDMTSEMLAALVKMSSQCRQLFSYWCFEAPIRLGKTSLLYGPGDKSISELPTNFKRQCNANKQTWKQHAGYLSDRYGLPITKMRFLNKKQGEFTRATLTLGPLECYESVAASKPNTATFLTPESFVSLRSWRNGTLSFIFRTSDIGTVVFHQTAGQKIRNSIIGLIAEEKLFVFEVNMNGKTQNISVTTSRPLVNGEWHSVNIISGTTDILFTVDSGNALLSMPVGDTIGPFRGMFKLGGSDQLPAGRQGFTGCISALTKDNKDVFLYDYYNEFKQDDIRPGCISKCASKPCQNEARCVDKWTTYECVCAHPAHQGKNCEIDNTKDVVSFSDPAVHLDYTPSTTDILTADIHLSFRTYHSDALLFYANDHLHNFAQLELMDGAVLVFKYNSGRQIVEVMIDSTEVMSDEEASNSSDIVMTAGSPFNTGAWVDVTIERKSDKTVLKVNDEFMEESDATVQLLTDYYEEPFNGAEENVKPPRLFVNPDKVDNYTLALIGGAPDKMTSLPGLQGCIRGFVIGEEPVSLKALATRTIKGVSTTCEDHCSQDVCEHNGECTELWSTFRCNCSTTSYSGRLCGKDVGASFQSASLLIYPFTVYDEEPAASTEMDSLTFGFSTTTSTGVLVYIRSDEEENMDKSIIIKLADGNVEASVDFGNGPTTISIEGSFNDGYRHAVVLRRYGNRILFDVDNQDGNFTTLSDNAPVLFTKRAAFVVGGVEYNMTRFGLEGSGGYEGCIAGLNYNGIKPLELLFGAYAPYDRGGVGKAQCAPFKMSESSPESPESPGLPDPSGNNGATGANQRDSKSSLSKTSPGVFVPWNVEPAVGQVYVEPVKEKDTINPDMIKYIIIGVCAVAIFILLLCIIIMACKLMDRDKEEKESTFEERTPLRRKDLEQVDAAPTRQKTMGGTPQKHSSPNAYTPVPQTEPQPPSQPKPQPEQPPPTQPLLQQEPQVVATGHFTVESSPELKDEPPIPMIDDDVEDDVTTSTPAASHDIPPPVPTSPPPELTPPQPKKSVTSSEPKIPIAPSESEKSVTGSQPEKSVTPSKPEETTEHKALAKSDSVLSDAETAV